MRDKSSGPKAKYTLELTSKLTPKILQAIESAGLIAFGDEALKYMVLHERNRSIWVVAACGF